MRTTGSYFDYSPRVGRNSAAKVDASPAGTRIREILHQGNASRPLPRGVDAQSRSDSEITTERQFPSDTSDSNSFTLLIADDHPVVREGLVSLINRQAHLQVIAQAGNGREAVEAFFAQRPDVALLDLRMPSMGGVEAAASIYEKDPAARLVILTCYESEEEIYSAVRAGAQGYLLKDAPVEELMGCIRAVGEGKTWFPPQVGAKLAKRVTDRELTRREMEVIRAMVKGKSNKEIGVLLDISEATVKVHVTHILEKMQAGGRTEAVGLAVKRGLVRIEAMTA